MKAPSAEGLGVEGVVVVEEEEELNGFREERPMVAMVCVEGFVVVVLRSFGASLYVKVELILPQKRVTR